jgi:hypothetical protein
MHAHVPDLPIRKHVLAGGDATGGGSDAGDAGDAGARSERRSALGMVKEIGRNTQAMASSTINATGGAVKTTINATGGAVKTTINATGGAMKAGVGLAREGVHAGLDAGGAMVGAVGEGMGMVVGAVGGGVGMAVGAVGEHIAVGGADAGIFEGVTATSGKWESWSVQQKTGGFEGVGVGRTNSSDATAMAAVRVDRLKARVVEEWLGEEEVGEEVERRRCIEVLLDDLQVMK